MVHTARRPRSFSLSRPELALLAITALWGGTYLVIHLAMRYSGPMFLWAFASPWLASLPA
ncbi:hypothetical protein NHF46_09915 [Arthrobacter alpinus]|nr:hypothetical protein [Arthrobacter alpinus]